MAPAGTVVVIVVAELARTVVAVPLNFTVLLAGIGSKNVPTIVTFVPTGPLTGVTDDMVGGMTVNKVALVAVWPTAVTLMGPVVADGGIVVVILVAELAVTIAAVPLNLTTLLPGVGSKLVPMIVTVAPTIPLVGVNDAITGGWMTVKLVALVVNRPLTALDYSGIHYSFMKRML